MCREPALCYFAVAKLKTVFRRKPKTLESSGYPRLGKSRVRVSQSESELRLIIISWVHSGKFWTSSGVTAGLDMAAAWLRVYIAEHVLDKAEAKKLGDTLLGVLEVT